VSGLVQRLPALLFLLLLAGVSHWLAGLGQEPDYFLNGLTATVFGHDGLPLRRLWAAELRHYPDDDSTEVLAPRLELYEADVPPWRLRAETAWLSGDGELLLLQGEVHVDREGAVGVRPLQAVTHNLRVQPRERYAETDERVSVHSAGSWVEATGMRAWLAGPLRLKLLSDARGRYEVD
jgi:lipopolysaccharide export system protein LptC